MTEPQKTKLIFEDKIAFLTLMRPEKRNAINVSMIDELLKQIRKIELSDALVVILTGCDGAFCAGGDIDEWREQALKILAGIGCATGIYYLMPWLEFANL